jgi:hypothetical protein
MIEYIFQNMKKYFFFRLYHMYIINKLKSLTNYISFMEVSLWLERKSLVVNWGLRLIKCKRHALKNNVCLMLL